MAGEVLQVDHEWAVARDISDDRMSEDLLQLAVERVHRWSALVRRPQHFGQALAIYLRGVPTGLDREFSRLVLAVDRD